MKKIIIKISVAIGIILILLLIVFSTINYFKIKKLKKENQEIIDDNKILIESYQKEFDAKNKEINDLKIKMKTYTKGELEKIECNKKDDIILDLQDGRVKLVTIIDSLMLGWRETISQLEKTNNQLIKTNKLLNEINKYFGIGVYAMGGISGLKTYLETQKINIDLIIGIDALFNFLNNRVSLIVGGYIKPYEDLGIGGKLGFNVYFGKGK